MKNGAQMRRAGLLLGVLTLAGCDGLKLNKVQRDQVYEISETVASAQAIRQAETEGGLSTRVTDLENRVKLLEMRASENDKEHKLIATSVDRFAGKYNEHIETMHR